MTFTRSSAGISNYNAFLKCDLIFYVEGKKDATNTYDEMYYQNLLESLMPAKKIKIKVIGDKKTALTYLKSLELEESDNGVVIVDKDLEGITSSFVKNKNKKLLITYGYSWENDFWTSDLCNEVVSLLTMHNTNAKNDVTKSYDSTLKSAAKISSFDAAAQINGVALLPKKESRNFGINLSCKALDIIEKNELKRYSKKYRSENLNCPISKEILKISLKEKPHKIIQGHIFEYIVVRIISHYGKKYSKCNSIENTMIKTLAFSIFIKDPLQYISTECLLHFKDQLSII